QWFPSLIGRLETERCRDAGREIIRFPSLIGRLETKRKPIAEPFGGLTQLGQNVRPPKRRVPLIPSMTGLVLPRTMLSTPRGFYSTGGRQPTASRSVPTFVPPKIHASTTGTSGRRRRVRCRVRCPVRPSTPLSAVQAAPSSSRLPIPSFAPRSSTCAQP